MGRFMGSKGLAAMNEGEFIRGMLTEDPVEGELKVDHDGDRSVKERR